MARLLKPNLLQKWARENASLEISLWLEESKGKNGQIVEGMYEIHKRNKRYSHIQEKLDRWVLGHKMV